MASDSYPPTIGACVKKWAEIEPCTPAFIFVDPKWRRQVLTRADVFRLSGKYAAILKRKGVKKGDIISNTLPNSPERFITHVGTILAGAISMNGIVFLKDGEDFFGSLRDAGSTAVVVDPDQSLGAASLLESKKVVTEGGRISYPELPTLREVLDVCLDRDSSRKSFLKMLDEEETEIFIADCKADDTAVIWATSGSTGFSKLIPLSHYKVLLFGEMFSKLFGLDTGDTIYNGGPLGWACGSLTTYLIRGLTRVVPDLSLQAPDDMLAFIWEVMRRENCAGAFLAPYHMECLVLNHYKNQSRTDSIPRSQGNTTAITSQTWRLKVIATGGQPLHKAHMRALGTLTDKIHIGYGCTETGMISCGSITTAADFENCNNGFLSDGVEVKIVGENGQEVGCGLLGEVICRSAQAFHGYLNNDASTQKTISKEGWINTGDIGRFNTKGELFVYCRKANSIMNGVRIVYPGWLETLMMKYPGMSSVMIVPVPDPVVHQELCACLVTLPAAQVDIEELRGFCKGLFLNEKFACIPKYFLFFDELPTTTTGKTCRKTTTAIAVERLGLKQ